ncbi:hypothetical protein [Lentilactobacillus sp. Marseille-Q4993]|uniref:hypothetical protein n=1 Tax=Lentilactobacillus sp. Marseille-Q4993 TaxID=3039492 RepID=UPI0024BC5D75|nr:hypothetical protein [Lentilactobacillus sp. Marseille-Q4993]
MGFSPALVFADICLIISIGIAVLIQKIQPVANVRIGLLILAAIFLIISISVNVANAVKKRKDKLNHK